MIKLPEAFEKRMKILLGSDFDKYIKALESEPVKGFRVNTDKISMEDFEKINIFGREKIPYVDTGYYLDFEKAGNHPYHHAGMIYIQEPGAMAPAECVDIEPGMVCLDMCAAPGGKSTQIKNKLGEKGILVSNEIISSRCRILTGNIERLGLKNCVTTCMDTKKLAKYFTDTFDYIMCDAPCSGEGMFRKEQIAIDEWSEENVKMCAQRQKEILENAVPLLKNGGYIVYATCTFSLEENEMVIDSFLSEHPDFELIEVNEKVKENTADGIFFDGCKTENIHFARRFYPHISKGEGQFMAVLHNKNENYFINSKTGTKTEKTDRIVTDFLDDVLTAYDKTNVTVYNGNPVYISPDIDIQKGSAFCCGVTIGEIRKNYIQPHHQFFMAMGKDFRRKIELTADDERTKKYLHGEEIATDCPDGWAVVTVDGCTAGGAKVSNGKAKNHYPKGLRLKNI
ncbi:MAG: RNA methyltransferase [Clostridia bacterium]|nr:RNA methyltransferase [Clostridia bacterium]